MGKEFGGGQRLYREQTNFPRFLAFFLALRLVRDPHVNWFLMKAGMKSGQKEAKFQPPPTWWHN